MFVLNLVRVRKWAEGDGKCGADENVGPKAEKVTGKLLN